MDDTPTRGALGHALRAALRLDPAGSDAELLKSFAFRHDEAALEALVRRHGPMVLGVCRRVLGHEQDAEDAFQATFLVLAKRAASVRDGRALGAWLHRVAVRAARQARETRSRRRARERTMHPLPEPEAPLPAGPNDLRPVLDEELDRLPEKYRVAVLLCDLAGKTRKEAADLAGVPEGTLSGRLTTAHRLLARRLVRRGVTPAGGVLAAALAADAGAEVPATLILSAARTGAAFAAGAAVPAPVAALARGVLKAMLLYRLGMVVLVSLGLIGLGLGAWFGASALGGSAAPTPVPAVVRPDADPPREPPPKEAAKPKVRTLTGHGGTARVVFSPVGGTVATFSDDKVVRLWDPDSGTLRYRLDGHTGLVIAAAFSPDGKVLATCDGATVRFWDVAKGEGLDTRAGPLAGTARLAYSPDGKRLACALDGGTVRIWDVAREKVERSFSAQHPRGVPVIASWAEFSPDGKLLAVATTDGHPGPSHLRLWDPETGELRKTVVDGTTQSIWGAVFSSDGKLLAVGDAGGTVGLFETRRWERVGRLESGDQLRSLAWGADSRTLALGLRRDVQVWDAVKGERRKTLRGHTNWVLSMAVSPDGKTLGSGSSDKTVRLWPLVDE